MGKWLRNSFWLVVLLVACQQKIEQQVPVFHFEDPFDTSDTSVVFQERKVFDQDSILFTDNQFDGARINDFERLDDTTFLVTITPENEPINPSPWYAFRVWSRKPGTYYFKMNYGSFRHRYYPMISNDGDSWINLDSGLVQYDSGNFSSFKLELTKDTLWVAGQHVISSNKVAQWAVDLAREGRLKFDVIGQSKLGRRLVCLKYLNPNSKGTVVVLSRQHPPEVTGYRAMQFFMDELLHHELSDAFFDRYNLLIYPCINPDGVDHGHWRHSAGGVDLNRDWGEYLQTEVKQVVKDIYKETSTAPVILGIDFHSTYRDVFYTNDTITSYDYVKEDWFSYMEKTINNYEVNEKSSAIKRPVSKSWFYAAFGAQGITYEVGDNTIDSLIELKGRASARGILMSLTKSR